MKYIVYVTVNKINKKTYVGVHQTINPDGWDGYLGNGIRSTQPSTYKRSKTPFAYAVSKYGPDNFIRVTLKVLDTLEEALELEAMIVTEEFIRKRDNYNATPGGGYPPSNAVKIYEYSINGIFIREWDSIVEASKFHNCGDSSIGTALKYKATCKSLFWSYEKFDKLNLEGYTTGVVTRRVYLYDEYGKLIRTYNTIRETAEALDTTVDNISNAIKRENMTKGFYYSTELLDNFKPKPSIKVKGKLIHLYDLEGNFYKTYSTPIEVCKEFGVKNSSGINHSLKTGGAFRGYQVSLEKVTRMKRLINSATPRRVGQYSKSGEFIKEFKSIIEAVREYGSGVDRALRGQQEYFKDFIFRFVEVNDIV